VARAKRTARADARRRYRATAEPEIDADLEATEASEAPRGARTASRSSQPPARQESQGRVGIRDALRISIHPPRFREDLAELPSLVSNRALLIPVLVTVGGAVLVATAGISQTSSLGFVAFFIAQYFLFPPSLGGPFIAGFLAPKASWLLGGIVGLVSAVCYAVIVLAFPLRIASTVPDAATTQSAIISAFLISPVMSAVFAAAAAWYRRFLRLSNPNRGRQPTRGRQAATPRRGDGRTRGANDSQKAGVRR
jgi:hypothetical protein